MCILHRSLRSGILSTRGVEIAPPRLTVHAWAGNTIPPTRLVDVYTTAQIKKEADISALDVKKRSASTANRTRGGSMATIQVTITPLMLEAVAIGISKIGL
jgi:hypothetical protein